MDEPDFSWHRQVHRPYPWGKLAITIAAGLVLGFLAAHLAVFMIGQPGG